MIYALGHFLKNALLPPVGLGWLLVFAIWQFKRRPRLARALVAIVLVSGFCLATPLMSEAMLRQVTLRGDPSAYSSAQAIVILGAESSYVWDAGQQSVLEANPGRFTMLRLHFGARLAKNTGLPILVSGGKSALAAPSLAEIMRQALQDDFGVSVRWMEDRSGSTAENAALSAGILLPRKVRRIILVTSGFHMRRAAALFMQAGFIVLPAPVPPIGPRPGFEWKELLPDSQSLLTSYYAFHEFGGLVYDALARPVATP
jgi:uncharacterized SAM-binding protein YcdF (DUF218 family)